jgi:hypothetical protein
MRFLPFILPAALLATFPGSVAAQTQPQTSATPSMTPLEIAVACAPMPTLDTPTGKLLKVIGAQDVVARSEFGNGDQLVIEGGSGAGVQLGQQYFLRHANRFGNPGNSGQLHQGASTGGWIRIVAVNETTSIAAFEHLCGPVAASDYLEPFAAPIVPPGADRDETPGEPDFNAMGRVLIGNEDRDTMAVGDFALIDRGSEQGMAPGARVALYRSVGVSRMPLASVGEAIVIKVGPSMSVTRVTRARDAIRSGDFVAPRKQERKGRKEPQSEIVETEFLAGFADCVQAPSQVR